MNRKLRNIALSALLLLSAMAMARADKIDDYVKEQMTARHIPGVAIGVVQDGKLMPGMSASVSIATLEKADALLIPRDAVATDSSGKQGVYVVQNGPNGQIATFKTPTLGASDGKNVEVIDGLNAGDVVIVSGQTSISNNQAVRTAGQGAGGASGKPQAAASGKPQASESAKPQAS